MQRYRNVHGQSGVTSFEARLHSIVVEFQDGWKYEYTEETAGRDAVQRMKQLAERGAGLSTYISQHVRDAYARKYR